MNGKKDLEEKAIDTVKVKSNPISKGPQDTEVDMNGGGGEAQEFRQKFRPQKGFYKHTYLVSHEAMKQCQASNNRGLKDYSGCPCGHRVA